MNASRLSLAVGACTFLVGCAAKVIPEDGSGGEGAQPSGNTTTTTTQSSGSSSTSPPLELAKVDVVFVVDNSADAGDLTELTVDGAHALISRLVNPECVDEAGNVETVASPASPCPPGFRRLFTPVDDMHVGVISSSLGALGAPSICESTGASQENNPTTNDRGHLIWRTNPSPGASANSPGFTYEDQGFFVWDPAATQSPPGLADVTELTTRLGHVLRGAGSSGCGLEMPLESAYRFLADPAPYDHLTEVASAGIAIKEPAGVDSVLLAQRAAFLRDDSVVIVVVVGNENDCSIVAEGQSWAIARPQEPWYRGSSICATDPSNACCYSCGLAAPSGCPADPICASPRYAAGEDNINLRCNLQKQRYGVSLLYPTRRYVNAFSAEVIAPGAIDLAPDGSQTLQNPLLAARNAQDVFVVTLTGVPWQETVRDPLGAQLIVRDPVELDETLFWSRYVGEPDTGVRPSEPIMQESSDPRPGVLPGNPYNGNDYVSEQRDELQLACRFPLAAPRPNGALCAQPDDADKPTCNGTTQTHAAAFPGTRQLRLAQGLGEQSVVASVCPPEVADTSSPAFGFRLAVDALARRLRGR